jgi:hypothetical protein
MEKNTWKGFVVDILDEISKQLNITFEIMALEEPMSFNSSITNMDSKWDEAVSMLQNGVF